MITIRGGDIVEQELEKKDEIIVAESTDRELINSLNLVEAENKTTNEKATDIAELIGTRAALQKGDLIEKVAKEKEEQILNSAKQNKETFRIKKEAEKIEALTKQDIAFYEQWKAVLNFGGVTESTTKGFAKFMLILILPLYAFTTLFIKMPFAIINSLLKVINETIENIARFTKAGRIIALSLLIIGGCAAIAFVIAMCLERFGG